MDEALRGEGAKHSRRGRVPRRGVRGPRPSPKQHATPMRPQVNFWGEGSQVCQPIPRRQASHTGSKENLRTREIQGQEMPRSSALETCGHVGGSRTDAGNADARQTLVRTNGSTGGAGVGRVHCHRPVGRTSSPRSLVSGVQLAMRAGDHSDCPRAQSRRPAPLPRGLPTQLRLPPFLTGRGRAYPSGHPAMTVLCFSPMTVKPLRVRVPSVPSSPQYLTTLPGTFECSINVCRLNECPLSLRIRWQELIVSRSQRGQCKEKRKHFFLVGTVLRCRVHETAPH